MRLANSSVAGLATLGLLITFAGCGESGLSRSKAKELIQASDAFKSQRATLHLTEEGVNSGAAAGYWKVQYDSYHDRSLELTARGRQLFTGTGQPGVGEPNVVIDNLIVTRQGLTPQVVQVTGITGGGHETERVVDFKWDWGLDGLPADVRGLFANPPQSGHATLKLYDDGWRVQGVQSE